MVEYHPGEPLSVALSRKTRISDLNDAKSLTPIDEPACRSSQRDLPETDARNTNAAWIDKENVNRERLLLQISKIIVYLQLSWFWVLVCNRLVSMAKHKTRIGLIYTIVII